jgi:hypothetical protein
MIDGPSAGARNGLTQVAPYMIAIMILPQQLKLPYNRGGGENDPSGEFSHAQIYSD